jgi:hypothetical protein
MAKKSQNKNSKLFRGDDDWWNNAVIMQHGRNWFAYSEGYKLAADIIVKDLIKKRGHIDFLIFPIVYLYRQSVELYLKEIIKEGKELIDEDNSFPKNHDLTLLWKECKSLILKIWPQTKRSAFKKIELCIEEFTKYDPTSEGFRYPVDKGGKPLLTGISHINIRNLRKTMDEMLSLLDGVTYGISECQNNKREMMIELGYYENKFD